MGKSRSSKPTLWYVERVLEDEYVQEQLRDALVRMGSAYRHASQERVRATEDKEFYESLRRTSISLRNAARALQQPKPQRRHRGRNLLIIAGAVGATVAVTKRATRQSAIGAASATGPTPAR